MSDTMLPQFHPLEIRDPESELPAMLNDPFDYTPHPLCRRAAEEVFGHIAQHPEWSAELDNGKMLGVLVVSTGSGEVGFLAACSGNLDGRNDHPYFVPPVYDILNPNGEFRRGEAVISDINRRIADIESGSEYLEAAAALKRVEAEAAGRLTAFRAEARRAKVGRDIRRAESSDPSILVEIDNESRREKSELRRLKAELNRQREDARAAFERLDAGLEALKSERRRRSEELQRMLFSKFIMAGIGGESKNLLDIFADAGLALPPAGAGECAAPKLLQFAVLNGLKPLAIAEFWYGRSPKGEVRRHGSCYPACRGKCKPILDFMLRGVALERRSGRRIIPDPAILYEDDCIVVADKPAGMLSVEGKADIPSVEAWALRRYAECQPKVVHRLDMDVSGLLLIAKNLDSYRRLQEQFLRRTVKKRYSALLEGSPAADCGQIELPIRPDPTDRPRQVVDHRHGKRALTIFRVKERREGCTLVEFEPVTGRTHQLRVHSASAEGLDVPIVGDTLYGAEPAARLFLHNEFIEFLHPVTGRTMSFSLPSGF